MTGRTRLLVPLVGLAVAAVVGLGVWARLGDVPYLTRSGGGDDTAAAGQVDEQAGGQTDDVPVAGDGTVGADPGSDPDGVLRPVPDPSERVPVQPLVAGDHWLGRGTMTAGSIELFWSPVVDAEAYRLYRIVGLEGFDVTEIALDAERLVYEGTGSAHVDTTVEVGSFYTYVLVVAAGGVDLDRRWAQTLAVDDVTPPAPIVGLTAERTAEGAMLTWEPSDDDVEFSSYSVSLVEGETLRYLGGGGDLEQVSFLDREIPAGGATYAVQAVDFHGNRTEPALITIDGP